MTTGARRARDACPFCGERVRVPAWKLFPTKDRRLVECGACKSWSQIARLSRISSRVAGASGAVAVALLTYPLGRWAVFLTILANLTCGYLAGRLTLRLDRPELAE